MTIKCVGILDTRSEPPSTVSAGRVNGCFDKNEQHPAKAFHVDLDPPPAAFLNAETSLLERPKRSMAASRQPSLERIG